MGKITIEAYTLVISNKSGILQMELLNYFSHLNLAKTEKTEKVRFSRAEKPRHE